MCRDERRLCLLGEVCRVTVILEVTLAVSFVGWL